MKRRGHKILIFLLLLFNFLFSSLFAKDIDFKRIVKVTVTFSDQSLRLQSSGILVAADNRSVYIVTTLHSLVGYDISKREGYYRAFAPKDTLGPSSIDPPNILVEFFYQNQGFGFAGDVFGFDQKLDLAVITIDSPILSKYYSGKPIAVVPFQQLKPTEKVFALGYSSEKVLLQRQSFLEFVAFNRIDFHGESLFPGISGGALISEKNHLIGIITQASQTISLAVNTDAIANFMRELSIPAKFINQRSFWRKHRIFILSTAMIFAVTSTYVLTKASIPEAEKPKD